MSQAWLKTYYGAKAGDLMPTLIFDGKTKAVVRLQRTGAKSKAGVAYVGITKFGRHGFTPHVALFEGAATKAALEDMKAWLAREDGK